MVNKFSIKDLDNVASRVARLKAAEYKCNGSKFKVIEWKLCTEWGDWEGSYLEIKFERSFGKKGVCKDIVYFNEHL